ncbi:regulator of Vps4 activity in the MVB pathway protein [Striga asiatica]|uniref:Regulator of Vps4 activity in the MVB pathway protein n=1 Tax=Striga asiatica TaxID=4170 RepID=A0A5A7PRZ2_STRAF|nr:regulator of Vps4 activity in the MVB pathway protein [Striga asiatica]
MSMLDSFFKQRFNAAKCKTLLKLTIPRIKLLRNRREIQVKQMRKDIAKLLETGQEATARIRVEHIIREEKMMAAQGIVELFCELIAVRLPIIDAQRECPLDLKEAISSVCFAAPRCADLPELLQVQMLFVGKYGKEFVSAATELMPECGVNRQLVELLSVRAPAPDVKLKLLKEIAEEHELDWDPAATESELLKPHEDLLNGSTLFVTGSKVPLPEEKHQETTHATSAEEKTDSSEVDPDLLDFPEVPKQQPLIVQPNKGVASAPEMLHFPSSALSDPDDEDEQSNSSSKADDEQFVPFMSPPPQSLPENIPSDHTTENNEKKVDLGDVIAAAQAAAETAERAAAAARSAASLAQLRISELVKKKDDRAPDPNEAENQSHPPHKQVSDDSDKRHSIDPSSPPGGDSGVVAHQPQRLPSMDDETYFSYPNLFSSQGSNLSTHQHSVMDTK